MFKTKSLSVPLILSLVLGVSAEGQAPLTQQQISHVNKVKKNLAHYDTGVTLKVRLSDGSHLVGTLSEAGSTFFVLLDHVSGKPERIDYLDVKGLQLTREEYMSQQLGKTARGIPIAVGIGLAIVAVVAIVGVTVGDR